MILPLSSVKQLTHVDTDIFTLRYFGTCMACTSCHDWCCQWGCDVNLAERDRILALKDELAPYVASPVEQWFEAEEQEDPEYETGRFVRARQVNGACVFRERGGRGCSIHRFAAETGRDYHRVKPSVCWLFPVSWDEGLLMPADEATDDLVCVGPGPTLYESARGELEVIFGAGLIAELDALAAKHGAAPRPAPRGRSGDMAPEA